MRIEKLGLRSDDPTITLTAYLQDETDALIAGPRPGILICPGGAYCECSVREGEPVALRFAAMGFHTFVLQYATFFAPGEKPDRGSLGEYGERPACRYPAALLDVARAKAAINEHAGEWNVDSERIAVCGFSAGGNNAALFATRWHEPWLAEAVGVASTEELRPAAAVLGYLVADECFEPEDAAGEATECARGERAGSAGTEGSSRPRSTDEVRATMSTVLFGSPELAPEQAALVQPARHVSALTPPTFLWGTAADPLIASENTLRMGLALARAGVPYELHMFEQGGHGLSLATQETARAPRHMRADVAVWVPLAETWLEKRFLLALAEA